jgi:hypothetical protein
VKHSHVIVAGPHADGTYTLAPVSTNPDPLGDGRPIINANKIVPEGHTLKGWIQLNPQTTKVGIPMVLSDKHPVESTLTEEQLAELKKHMKGYENWKKGDPVKQEHTEAGHAE